MNTTSLLAELQERGVILTLAGDRLRWRGPRGAVTPALRAALVAHKWEVRRVLEGAQVGAQDLDAAGRPGGGETPADRGPAAQTSPSGAQGKPADLEARLGAMLAELQAATGAPDDVAEDLLSRWASLEAELTG